jgi:hypothetical protein
MPRLYFIFGMLFLLMAMGADNIIDRSVYGEWYGKPGDRLTEALNILRIVISLFLVWWGFHKTQLPRFNRVLPLAAVSFIGLGLMVGHYAHGHAA